MLVELSSNMKNYAITDLEVLGIVWAIKHFHHYLYGHHCEDYTDYEPLIALLNTPHPSGKLARWELILQDVDLVIRYHSGKKNACADALSCLPIDQDDNGESSLSEKQDDNNDIFVVATVIGDNAKSGKKDGEENNENKNNSSCCQQEQRVSSDNVNIRSHQREFSKVKLIMDYL